MGHQIEYASYSIKASKRSIECHWNELCKRWSDYGGGLYEPIEWIDRTFANRQEAREWMEEHDRPYRQFAVKYREGRRKCWLCKFEWHC